VTRENDYKWVGSYTDSEGGLTELFECPWCAAVVSGSGVEKHALAHAPLRPLKLNPTSTTAIFC